MITPVSYTHLDVYTRQVVYGADVDVATIINAAKRYPMMSEHQVVVVKEAQAVRNMGLKQIRPIKFWLILIAVIIAISSLYVSHSLISDLSAEERVREQAKECLRQLTTLDVESENKSCCEK